MQCYEISPHPCLLMVCMEARWELFIFSLQDMLTGFAVGPSYSVQLSAQGQHKIVVVEFRQSNLFVQQDKTVAATFRTVSALCVTHESFCH